MHFENEWFGKKYESNVPVIENDMFADSSPEENEKVF